MNSLFKYLPEEIVINEIFSYLDIDTKMRVIYTIPEYDYLKELKYNFEKIKNYEYNEMVKHLRYIESGWFDNKRFKLEGDSYIERLLDNLPKTSPYWWVDTRDKIRPVRKFNLYNYFNKYVRDFWESKKGFIGTSFETICILKFHEINHLYLHINKFTKDYLQNLTKKKLLEMCQRNNLKKLSKLKKQDLINLYISI